MFTATRIGATVNFGWIFVQKVRLKQARLYMCMRTCKSVLSGQKDSQTFSSFATQNPRCARPAFLRVHGGDEEDRTPDPPACKAGALPAELHPHVGFVFLFIVSAFSVVLLRKTRASRVPPSCGYLRHSKMNSVCLQFLTTAFVAYATRLQLALQVVHLSTFKSKCENCLGNFQVSLERR